VWRPPDPAIRPSLRRHGSEEHVGTIRQRFRHAREDHRAAADADEVRHEAAGRIARQARDRGEIGEAEGREVEVVSGVLEILDEVGARCAREDEDVAAVAAGRGIVA
jgi:hypothetical protein